MSDDFGGLFDGGRDEGSAVAVSQAAQLAGALGRLDLSAVSGSSLTARGDLVRLHAELARIERVAHDRRQAIERAFVMAGAEQGADQFRTDLGIVALQLPQAAYETRAQALREELQRLIPQGLLSQAELDAACPVVVSYSVNHTKLNVLHRHRGEAVREVIDRHRVRREPDPLAAKVRFPTVKEEDHVEG